MGDNIRPALYGSEYSVLAVEKINEELSKGIKITNIDNKFNKEILFDIFSKFTLFKEKDEFIF